MADLIQRSAYLWTCPNCKDHGQIFFTNGMETLQFATKFLARLFLEAACNKGYVTEPEVLVVKQQIDESRLGEGQAGEGDILRLTDEVLVILAQNRKADVLETIGNMIHFHDECDQETVH